MTIDIAQTSPINAWGLVWCYYSSFPVYVNREHEYIPLCWHALGNKTTARNYTAIQSHAGTSIAINLCTMLFSGCGESAGSLVSVLLLDWFHIIPSN